MGAVGPRPVADAAKEKGGPEAALSKNLLGFDYWVWAVKENVPRASPAEM